MSQLSMINRYFRIFFILIIVLLSPLDSLGQMRKKCLAYGDQFYSSGNPAAAIGYYRMAMEIDSSEASLNFKLAQAYMVTNNYKKAYSYFKQCTALDNRREFPLAYFYAGEMDKILGNYPACLKWYRKFIRRQKGGRNSHEYLKSKLELSAIRETSRLFKDTSSCEISNEHDVNTPVSEFAPFFQNDTMLLFSSLRSDSLKGRKVLDTATYYSRIYHSSKKDQWLAGEVVALSAEAEKTHYANSVSRPGSTELYYTKCSAPGKCKIFKARFENGQWVNELELPAAVNALGTNSSQPMIVRLDGFNILYFSSDRPGGKGKMDLWSCVAHSNGIYEEAINLGDSINSPGNEICPFFSEKENALYFSSDFHPGLGGFDIHRSGFVNGHYSSPVNLGLPFNSTYNDLYFRYLGGKGVLSSNREGAQSDNFENCCSDLYFFNYQPEIIQAKGVVANMERIKRLLPIKLFFENDEPNPRSTDTSTSVLYSAAFINYTAKIDDYEREYSRGLKGLNKEEAALEVRNFFDFEISPSFSDFKEAMQLLLDELALGHNIHLDIKGYASPLSNSDYNRKLTLRRIKSVVNEIEHYNGSALLKFLENGQLNIRVFPFGEDRASQSVSDDFNDRRNAIYSKKAAFERRVEIISIEIQ
ncbi:MAG: hypothetical protein RIC15_09805 [Vicingaceae bacterium]